MARSGLQAQSKRGATLSGDTSARGPRWEQYVLESASGVPQFWASHLRERERDVLFIMGKGFDPRMCSGVEMVLGTGGAGRRDVLAIEFDEGITSPSKAHDPLVAKNWERLETACAGRATLSAKSIQIRSGEGRRIGSRQAAGILSSAADIARYSDLVIDISALPRGIYVPLIAKALYLLDSERTDERSHSNLHVLVCEDPALDRSIRDEGIEETASYVHGFSGGLEMEATAGQPKIWIPVLGEGQKVQLGIIYDLILPDEICPVLPSPSVDPRRADDLVLEYRELLFDRLRVVDTPIVVQYIRKTGEGLPYHRFSWSCPNCGRWFPNYKPILLRTAEAIIAGIKDPNVFFFDRASPAALAVARAFAEKGAVVVFEPSGVGNKTLFRQALRVAHILKYSNERLGNLAETVGSAPVPLQIETLGGDGLRYRSCIPSCDTTGWRRLEAYRAKPFKDAAGAGDWCTAGIIHRLAQKGMYAFRATVESRLVEALKFGQALAAWSCKFEGARAGMYSVSRAVMRAEVEGIMRGTPRPVALRRKLDVGRAEAFKKICEGCDQGDPR